jgi:hypothetical protein
VRLGRLAALSISRFRDRVRDLRCTLAREATPPWRYRLEVTVLFERARGTESFTIQDIDLDRLLARGFGRLQRDVRRKVQSRTGASGARLGV